MRRNVLRIAVLTLLSVEALAQTDGVLIDYTGATRDNSAVLESFSTTQGVLIPRMTEAQRNAIVSPATSLLIFQTNNTPGYYFNAGTPGSPVWQRLFAGSGSPVTGSGAATRVAFWDGPNSLSSNANLYWDNDNSRLGIGQTAPGSQLHVGSTGWSANQLHFSSGWGGAGGYHATIGSGFAGITSSGIMLGTPHVPYRASYGAKMRHSSDQASSFYWDLGINGEAGGAVDRFDLNRNNVNLMSVLSNGNVGIGTTGAGSKMEVVGDALTLSGSNLDMNRDGFARHGISWYSKTYPSWSTYMAQAGQTSVGPHGDLTAPSGIYVNSWAMRSYIENVGGYGWTFESAANTTTPAVRFEIRASDGLFHAYGAGIVDGTLTIGGGSPAANRVLISSNAAGLATWADQSTLTANYANLTGIPTRTAWVGVHRNFVAEQLSWKHHGNNHTIFDASNSTSPQGTAVNNTDAQIAWSATYPTLMGWNGTNTYGVRVDAARQADRAYYLRSPYPYNINIGDGTTAATLSEPNSLTSVNMHASHGLFGSWATTLTMSGYDRYGAYQISGNYNAAVPELAIRNYVQSTSTWNSWVRVLTSANIGTNAIQNQFTGAQSAEFRITGRGHVQGEFYYNGWLRHMGASQSGLYWQEGVGQFWHMYPANQQDMIFRTGSGNGGIMGTVVDATPRGYVHWTNTNEIGFLNSGRAWSLRVDNAGNSFHTASSRAPIFYDLDNTAFYLDPNGTSELNVFTRNTLARSSLNGLQNNSPVATRSVQADAYKNGAMGWGQVDFNVITNWGNGFIDTWSNPANAPGGSTHYTGIQSMHHTSQNSVNFYGFQMVTAGESVNRYFLRNSWNVPRPWVEMIHTGNIGSYGDNLGNHIATTTLNMNGNVINNFRRIEPLGIGGNSGEGNNAYAIFQEGGAWTYPYPDLRIAYHTGIKLGANASYNGIRFYTDYDMSSLVMSVNDGSTGGAGHVYMSGNLGIRTTPTLPLDVFGAGVFGDGTYRARIGWYQGSEPLVIPNVGNWGGVGTSNEYWFFMYARSYYAINGYYYFSDGRMKTNIKTLSGSLDKIKAIRGVSYDHIKDSKLWNDKEDSDNYEKLGFIAQEIQDVFPNIVKKTVSSETSEESGKVDVNDSYLSVDYTRLIPVIVEAIKEQQVIIDRIVSENNELKSMLKALLDK